jgi:predicted TIM-barrel fold metal-dependent hydrolase
MIIDAHIHCSGEEQISDVLHELDVAGVDKAVLLAPFLSGHYSLHNAASLRQGNEYLAALIRTAKDRLIGFAVINPLDGNALGDFEYAIERGLRGLKLVPAGWYPYDDAACRLYELAERLSIPILFHSGIFIDGKSGRFCRPVFYEAIRDFPNLRVTLAHLAWPWTDEANAVGLIDLINGVHPNDCQFRFDISFGAPPVYRLEVFRKALAVLSPALLQFGSDRFLPCSGAHIKEKMDEVSALFDQLDVTPQDRERIMGGTAAAWLGL